jgi:hypothetical protein
MPAKFDCSLRKMALTTVYEKWHDHCCDAINCNKIAIELKALQFLRS